MKSLSRVANQTGMGPMQLVESAWAYDPGRRFYIGFGFMDSSNNQQCDYYNYGMQNKWLFWDSLVKDIQFLRDLIEVHGTSGCPTLVCFWTCFCPNTSFHVAVDQELWCRYGTFSLFQMDNNLWACPRLYSMSSILKLEMYVVGWMLLPLFGKQAPWGNPRTRVLYWEGWSHVFKYYLNETYRANKEETTCWLTPRVKQRRSPFGKRVGGYLGCNDFLVPS